MQNGKLPSSISSTVSKTISTSAQCAGKAMQEDIQKTNACAIDQKIKVELADRE
jgi:hypothetical protein